ncbi:Molybdenum cofactor biosynthesis enzyme and related Fe-S oxidoreductases [hydrothermal vent metagenome]|uniref:Molybdenum cofactor biosynthesis enzyme and related Fe-S oxidoreductases n=1 Tax=hydrothermal vent metagenome TaxID=652676 RepID=A0A1W1E7L0_9ZZZZ
MKFYRIYIEITNVCGLACSFCPTKTLPPTMMTPAFFESVIVQAKAYTKEIACHVMGDPLTHPHLHVYLEIIHRHGLKAVLTTSGYFLKKQTDETLFHPAVKQINISLNSYNKNDSAISLEQYMAPVLALCRKKKEKGYEGFINLRLWNLDEAMSERDFNASLFKLLSAQFPLLISLDEVYKTRPRSIRLASKVLLHFDTYFEWPSLENPDYGDGTCLGLQSHIGVLADGRVVPCCLDSEGVITLGNLHETPLQEILSSQRAVSMVSGFKEGKAVEELCQKCSYKKRFEERSSLQVSSATVE